MGQGGRPDKVRLTAILQELYRVESRRFVLWLPVLLGIGIWAYFALPFEPAPALGWVWIAPAALIASGIARRGGWGALAACWAAGAIAAGFGLAILSARMADAPQIRWPLGETVEGRVIEVSRSASGAPRLLLDRVIVYGVEPGDTPARLRVTVLDDALDAIPLPGQRVRIYVSLIPTGEPVEPGAFDFHRRAFFERIGGIGLTRGHLLVVPPPTPPGPIELAVVSVAELRATLSRYLREVLPGRQGTIAAALTVGDRADISEADNEALRISSLAHLLSISGLHMAILTGLVFGIARLALAAVPWTAYRWSTKKLAAVAGLLAGVGYLLLSGATVPTQRAFLMAAVALAAVLVDRPAITLRALALAAVVVLVLKPVSLLDAGFQMSFAATAALVAGYEALRRWRARRERQAPPDGRAARIVRMGAVYLAGLVFTSLLAGSATAPFAAYHFNRGAPYGLVANLLAVPVTGVVIAPAAVIAAVLAPLGLAEPALRAMGLGIELVMEIAYWVAALPGADRPVRAAPPVVLGLIAVGGLWLALWRGPWRLAGVAGILAGLAVWAEAPSRPDLLVAPGGRLIGMMGTEGRVLDHGSHQSFAAETWLRRDADTATQEAAAARPGLERDGRALSAVFANGWRLEVRGGRPEPADLAPLCRPRTLLIARNGGPVDGPCLYFGEDELAESGALAFSVEGDGLTIRATREEVRGRLWSRD
jgi:competence protein ComEC